MQFGIRDILILTSVAALAVVAFLAYKKADRVDSQIRQARFKVEGLQGEVANGKERQPDFRPRMDYVEQVRLASEAAANDFGAFRERYSDIEPEPGKIVARSIPEFSATGIVPKHLRLIVPEEYPVFLRTAILLKEDRGNKESFRIANAIDEVVWQTNVPFSDPQPHEIRLESGTIDLWLSTDEKSRQVRISLGKKVLFSTAPLREAPGMIYSTGTTAIDRPRAFSVKETTNRIWTVHFGKYDLWVWLSSNSDVAGFSPFPNPPSEQEADVNE